MKNKIFTVFFIVALMLFIITFSIGLPIYCRFFYYWQIGPLGLVQKTGYSFEQIKSAYDEVLNYLTLPNKPFGTGVFICSEEGASHFADCKGLFNLNLIVLITSSAILILTFILKKKKLISLCRPFSMHPAFISAISIFAIIFLILIFAVIDFSAVFVVFHLLFFAGKDNWMFDPRETEIIKALPEQFFMNCAILIGISILAFCLSIIIVQLIKRKKSNIKNNEKSRI